MGHSTIGDFLKRLHHYDITHTDVTFTKEENEGKEDLKFGDFSSIRSWNKYKNKMRRLGENYDKIKVFSILMLISSIVFFDIWASIPIVLIILFLVVLKAPLREAHIDIITDIIDTVFLFAVMALCFYDKLK